MKLPSFSYLIENMLMFQFQKNLLLLVVYENEETILFDFDSGIFQH